MTKLLPLNLNTCPDIGRARLTSLSPSKSVAPIPPVTVTQLSSPELFTPSTLPVLAVLSVMNLLEVIVPSPGVPIPVVPTSIP